MTEAPAKEIWKRFEKLSLTNLTYIVALALLTVIVIYNNLLL